MQLLEKPRYRFVLWAAIVVAVAAGTGAAGLVWWVILVCVFGAWIVLTAVERRLERRPAREQRAEAAAVAAPTPAPEPERAREPEPEAELPTLTPESTRRRRFLPSAPVRATSGTAVAERPQKQWSIWALDKVARDTTNAELRYLVLSLQEYADADGMLPLQFDPLVRESFGELLGVPR